jgi:hypothetical protein
MDSECFCLHFHTLNPVPRWQLQEEDFGGVGLGGGTS